MPDIEEQLPEEERPSPLELERKLTRFDYTQLTPEQVVCGRCDRDPAGRGAAMVNDAERGVIIACLGCQTKIRKEAAHASRLRARARERLPRVPQQRSRVF